MRCRHCGQEVALAKICPYCGRKQPKSAASESDEPDKEHSQGVFRGRMGRSEARAGEPPINLIPAALRYFSDPEVKRWKKTAILLGFFYVLSPIDVVPGAIFPVLGWLDDAVVATFAWRLLSHELAKYRGRLD